jgi:hypothetical protein
MSRLSFDSSRQGRGGESSPAREDDSPRGRSGAAAGDDAFGARLRERRDDPAGRRSLTGLEFRRQRSM